MSEVLPCTVVEGIRCFSPEVARSYADYPDDGLDLTDKIGERSFWVRSRNRLFKRIIQDHLRASGRTRLLEIGCGTGGFLKHLAGDDRLEITGSEVYLKGLLYARKNLPHVEFIQFDVTRGVLGEQFDLIVAFDVIEHIDDDVAAVSNIHQMLSEGGHFIATVPQYRFLWSRLDEIVRHKRRYSRKELTDRLRARGFAIRFCSSFVFVLFPLMLLSRLFDRGGGGSDASELERRVSFPRALDWSFDQLMRIDEALIRAGVSLPFGGSLLVVARKGP